MKVQFIAETEEMIRAAGAAEPPKKKMFCRMCGRPGGNTCFPIQVSVGPADLDKRGWWLGAYEKGRKP